MQLVNEWLLQRNDSYLHPYQLNCLQNILKVFLKKKKNYKKNAYFFTPQKLYNDFELDGVPEDILICKAYEEATKRLQVCDRQT